MEKEPDIETLRHCLEDVVANLEYMGKRLAVLRSELPWDQEFPEQVAGPAYETERLFQKVNNLMVSLPFPRI